MSPRFRFEVWGLAAIALLVAGACVPSGDDDDDAGAPAETQCLDEDMALPVTIDVERSATGEIETYDLEEYIKGVVLQEVGAGFPYEAIKAQSVAARTYAVQWVYEGKGPICDTTMCQVYSNDRNDVVDAAVEATRGLVLTYEGELVLAVYHASSGGRTEDVHDVWGGYLDYLVPVSCLENALCTGDCDDWYPVSAAPCDLDGSACCWGRNGHGVGMSQRGAQAMAGCGYLFDEILTNYYTGVALSEECG